MFVEKGNEKQYGLTLPIVCFSSVVGFTGRKQLSELSNGASISIPLNSFQLVRKGNISKHVLYNFVVFIMIFNIFFLFLVG